MTQGRDIGETVALMRAGHKMRRSGWNGKGMYLELIPASIETMMQEFVAMKTVQGTKVPWLCSQTDLLATDWEVAD